MSADSLAHSLDPVLHDECRNHHHGTLGPIAWFKVSWQHSGAATGFATWTFASGKTVPVMVKLPVGPTEHRWTCELGALDEQAIEQWDHASGRCRVTPRVLASGTTLGGYDLAWLVMERLGGGTLRPSSSSINERSLTDMLTTLDGFHAACGALREPSGTCKIEDWQRLLAKARDMVKQGAVPQEQRWNEALKRVNKQADALIALWQLRPMNTWCHGDFHPGNSLLREGCAGDQACRNGCVLIDLALVHVGHWVEDALYLERLFWARPDLIGNVKPISLLAKLRRERGMHATENDTDLANARRVLMAATSPAFILAEGHPRYLQAAVEVIEKHLPLLPH
jgi:aminoglycoside phosphotransferase (APT) family kinase protein